MKTILALIFTILLLSWFLSWMPQRDGFEANVPEIDQINYMHLATETRDAKKENMEDGDGETIEQRLAIMSGNTPSADMPMQSSDTMPMQSESMLNMTPV